MKTSQVYDRYILKAEKNSTNDYISTDKQRFIELYNEWQTRFLEYIYDLKNEDDFRYIESLLILNHKLQDSKKSKEFYSFELPKNYFDLSSAYALGSKGNCKGKKIDLPIEANNINVNLYLNDENTKPSFEYRESLFTIASGNINVYYTDFGIDSTILSYYRYPKKLRLQDPNNPESDFDDSFDIDFDDKAINRIISATVSGFDLNNNSDRWQLNNNFSKKDL